MTSARKRMGFKAVMSQSVKRFIRNCEERKQLGKIFRIQRSRPQNAHARNVFSPFILMRLLQNVN